MQKTYCLPAVLAASGAPFFVQLLLLHIGQSIGLSAFSIDISPICLERQGLPDKHDFKARP
jgi:hypothetical protein